LAQLLYYYYKMIFMTTRTITYFSKNKALKIIERPLQVDLQTLLSATFAISRNKKVKKDIQKTLLQLHTPAYRLSA
jgi:hypothetical protein